MNEKEHELIILNEFNTLAKSISSQKLKNYISDNLDIKNIMSKYGLDINDIRHHIKLLEPFCSHICPVCGKTLHINPKRLSRPFPKHCSAKCSGKDPATKALRAKTNLSLFGCAFPQQLDQFKDKIKETNLKKYGCEWSTQSEVMKAKAKKTNLSRYGNEIASKTEIIKQKTKESNLKKYGVVSTALVPEIKAKQIATLQKNYGVDNPLKSEEILQKFKQTNLKKYGVERPFQSKEIQNKVKAIVTPLVYENTYNFILSLSEKGTIKPLFSKESYQGGINHEYLWQCKSCGYIFKSNYANGKLPHCPNCCPRPFRQLQNEVKDYICTLGIKEEDVIFDSRNVISPYEIDIFIPSLNMGIEFNGTYWHSENCNPDKNYHLNKTKLCEEKGIHLIHIFEYQWKNNLDKIKMRLKNLLDKKQKRIFARKCIVKEITNKVSNEFLNKYHLQGYCASSLELGLFYKDELVSVMTFGKPRFNNKYQYELLRFCTSQQVVGAAGKLLKYFERKYKPNSLISYANRCWSSKLDNVYEKIGFKLIDESDPGYIYVKGEIVLNRYQCQKHKLKDVLGEDKFNPLLSESENMKANNFYKIYDCGNLVFIKTYNS